MGRDELARALEKKGRVEIKSIWRQAEAEVESYRRQRQEAVDRQRQECRQQAEESALQECRQVTWRIERLARTLRLRALHELEDCLRRLARDELARIEPGRRRRCLERLAAELPDGAWQRITVHPDDVEAAEDIFAGCRIEADPELAGGLTAATGEEQIRIDNTLNRRLETVWPEMSSRILTELENDSDDRSAAATEG